MTEPVAIEASALHALNDQLWRRLGITQTFDRLLVETAAAHPGRTEEVRDAAGRQLTGGAAKFYQMSFPQLLRDLCRRNVLAESSGSVGLDAGFADRLRRLVSEHATGVSRVEPTPGVTLEDVLHQVEARQEREKALKAAGRRTARATKAEKPARQGASPKRRAGAAPEPAAAPVAAVEAPAIARTPAAQLFNSIRLNKLLDVLDTGSLNRDQLAGRLGLEGNNLERFLQVCEAQGITRGASNMVELHWHGRELARTANADRRMAVIDAVKALREKASELDV